MPVGAGSQADYTDDSRWLGYDGLDRLTVANSRDQNARMQWGYGWGDGGFEYDALDNLRRFRMGPLDLRYHHDSQQRLQGITFGGVGFRSYAHNARGQMTQREHADRQYSLSWDSAHRLLSTQAPGHSESYRYDAHGHRVRTQRSGETVWSVYSRAGTLLFEQTSLGQNRRHIHLGARQVAETRNGQRRYLHTDHLGTPRVQTDAFGTVVQRDVRAPYGSVLAGFDYRQGAGFTGHMEDGATALTYMKARYYDPVAMRFLSPDPVYVDLGTGGNFNRYWYANNNPYTNVDPDGRQARPAVLPRPPAAVPAPHTSFPDASQPDPSWNDPVRAMDRAFDRAVSSVFRVAVEIVAAKHGLAQLSESSQDSSTGTHSAAQPDERHLKKVKEREGNKVAQDHGYADAHDAKEGRGEGGVDIYRDRDGKYWLWNGKRGGEKEEL